MHGIVTGTTVPVQERFANFTLVGVVRRVRVGLNWSYFLLGGCGNVSLSNNSECEVCETRTGIHPMAESRKRDEGKEKRLPPAQKGLGATQAITCRN